MARRLALLLLVLLMALVVLVLLPRSVLQRALTAPVWSRLFSSQIVAAAPAASSASLSLSSVRGRPSLSVAFVNRVLVAYRSPAVGLGQALYADSLHFGIDDVYALAFFLHESTFGRYGVARVTHSLGNIVCTPGYPSCVGRFRWYPTWQAGAWDWFHLLATLYLPHGLTTLERIVPVYAPASENNVMAYLAAVKAAVSCWRAGQLEVR